MIEGKTSLYPWQQQAVDKLSKLKVAALYMEQGTGKTRTALELVLMRLNVGKVEQVLWLCPCSVKSNLNEDIKKHLGFLPSNFYIVGLESISGSDKLYLELDEYVKKKTFLVVDESILVKNPNALRSQRIISLAKQVQYKLILNGTPVTKNEVDLFSQWYVLDWRILGYRTYYSFAANHLEYYTITLPNGHKYVDKSRIKRVLEVDYLTRKIEPYTYQITKAECGIDLLPKRYYRQYYMLSAEQREEYEQVKYDYLLAVDEFKSETIYKLFTALQHIVSGRRVLTQPDEQMETEPMFDDWRKNPRMQALMTLVTEKIKDEKCIIFCKYKHEVDTILQMLKTLYNENCALAFTGDVNQRQRQKNRIEFANDVQFLVANRACGAFGLNLQFCHNVIYYSNDFDWGTRAQSEDRVHRLGQTREVHIYDILADFTIDERIANCLMKKENLVDNFKNELRNIIMDNVKFSIMSVEKNGSAFYTKLGYLFASRTIRKDLRNYPLNNEDNWEWIVTEWQEEVIGFTALESRKSSINIDVVYVFPQHRRKGILKAMLKMVLNLYADSDLTVTCTQEIRNLFELNGFDVTATKSNTWLNMRRTVNAKSV